MIKLIAIGGLIGALAGSLVTGKMISNAYEAKLEKAKEQILSFARAADAARRNIIQCNAALELCESSVDSYATKANDMNEIYEREKVLWTLDQTRRLQEIAQLRSRPLPTDCQDAVLQAALRFKMLTGQQ